MTFTDALTAAAAVIGGLILLAMAVVAFLLDHEAESGELAPVIDLHEHRTSGGRSSGTVRPHAA